MARGSLRKQQEEYDEKLAEAMDECLRSPEEMVASTASTPAC